MPLTVTTPYKSSTLSSVSGTTFTSVGAIFAAGDVGRCIVFHAGPALGQTRKIVGYTSTTVVTVDFAWNVSGIDGITEDLPVATNGFYVSYKLDDIDNGADLFKRSDSQYEVLYTTGGTKNLTLRNCFVYEQNLSLRANLCNIALGGATNGRGFLRLGDLASDGTVTNGCHLAISDNSTVALQDTVNDPGVAQFYGCLWEASVATTTFLQLFGVELPQRLYRCHLYGRFSGRFHGAKAAIAECVFDGNAYFRCPFTTKSPIGVVRNITVRRSDNAFYWYANESGNTTVSGLRASTILRFVSDVSTAGFAGFTLTLQKVMIAEIPTVFVNKAAAVSQNYVIQNAMTLNGADAAGSAVDCNWSLRDTGGTVRDSGAFTAGTSGERLNQVWSLTTATIGDRNFSTGTTRYPFTYRIREFGYLPVQGTWTALLGEVVVPAVMLVDATTGDKATAAAITGVGINTGTSTVTISANRTVQEVYNHLAWWLAEITNHGTSRFASLSNGVLDLSAWDLVVDTGVTLTGKVTTTGTVTRTGTGTITGGYTYSGGAFVPLSITGLVSGARIQVYNTTDSIERVNAVASGTTYSALLPYTADKTMRLRVAYVSGATGKLPVELVSTLSADGVSFLVSTVDDTVYNDIGINGSTVTEYLADFPNVEVDVNDPDGTTTVQRLYSWYANEITTEDGIAQFFGGLVAEDATNFRINTDIVDLRLQNVGTLATVLVGARLYRSDRSTIFIAGSAPMQADPGKAYVATDPDPWEKLLEAGLTREEAFRIAVSALAGKVSGAGTTTVAIRDIGDTKNRIVATVDANGNRSSVTLDGA
ncbi:MAG: hypothetical protein H0W48_00495 [Methylibium sp.]|nr:hypothetical protein [Methylibium sp.]